MQLRVGIDLRLRAVAAYRADAPIRYNIRFHIHSPLLFGHIAFPQNSCVTAFAIFNYLIANTCQAFL